MSTPVAEWQPPFFESLKLAWKPIAVYAVFTFFGFVAFFFTLAFYEHGNGKLFEVFAAVASGFVGVTCGLFVAVLRIRTIPVLLVGAVSVLLAIYVVAAKADLPSVVVVSLFFFCFAFPSGMLALHHRFELLGVFWPAIGWIGSVMVILNEEGRVSAWEKSKASAWLPIPLILLGFFLTGLLVFMASKQAMRVSTWQALSGSVERRVQQRGGSQISTLPRKNLLPLLGAVLVLFAFTAVLAPYLWRTGKGDRDGKGRMDRQGERGDGPKPPELDVEAIAKAMQRAGQSAKSAAHTLWPLLLLALLYRPIKRGALTSHLVTPIFPTPPSERIDNLWEYVRIAAEDAGNVPRASDSVDDFVKRNADKADKADKASGSTDLETAARIYERTRYGFVVAPGDSLAMKKVAVGAAKALRGDMTVWERVRSFWRPLS